MDLLKRVLRLVEETRLLFKAQSIAQGVVINASAGNFFGNFYLSLLFDLKKKFLTELDNIVTLDKESTFVHILYSARKSL